MTNRGNKGSGVKKILGTCSPQRNRNGRNKQNKWLASGEYWLHKNKKATRSFPAKFTRSALFQKTDKVKNKRVTTVQYLNSSHVHLQLAYTMEDLDIGHISLNKNLKNIYLHLELLVTIF